MDELLADNRLSARERSRITCIRLLALGWEAQDVAEAVGITRSSVYRRKAEFLKDGESTLHTDRWGGRRGGVLTEAQEAEFVAHFEAAARQGQMVSAAAMAGELARRAGRPASPATLYRILARHGWRKVVPRPRHPEADPARQEAFKETSRSSWRPPGRTIGAR
jgi:transposase